MSTNHELFAGMAAGVAGLLVFLIIHHFWIRPIWFILPPGLVIALLGGLAAGWSYREIQSGLPPRPWTALAMVALIAAILAPGIVLAQIHKPTLNTISFTIPKENAGRAATQFFTELVLTAVIVGGIAGWLLGHTRQAAFATALAGLVYALGPGHNIPFLGQTPGLGKGLVLLMAITLVSAIVLVETSAWLARR